jgi:hypothetical protein
MEIQTHTCMLQRREISTLIAFLGQGCKEDFSREIRRKKG